MPVVTALFRYPVKGLSPEALSRATLLPDQGIPGDRQFAIAHGTTSFDPAAPKYLPKAHFLMLMRNGALAALRTAFDADSGVLTIRRPDGDSISGNLNDPAGRAVVEDFMSAYLGAEVRGRPKVVTAPGHMFSDVATKVVSLINLASVRDIEARAGKKVDPLRFRGNVHFECPAPWVEFDWIGRELQIGSVRFEVIKRIVRCAATEVDPDNGARDLGIPSLLQREYGHADTGVYARVVNAGDMSVGDALSVAARLV